MHDAEALQQLARAFADFGRSDPAAASTAAEFAGLLRDGDAAFLRRRLDGHFTASAWLVSADGRRALLTHHRKLDRWLQPGGHADGDRDLARAALREAEEEIGLNRRDVMVAGATEPYRSGSGYLITPVLGVIPPDMAFDPNPDEVEDWFEVPLDILFDPDNYARQHANWQGHDRHYYDMDWQGRRIWGVTAGIIINLARRLPAGWHR